MPRDNFTDVTIILDRSGSMSGIQDATIKGFNDFVNEQRSVPGDGCWTLVQFDDRYETVYAQRPQHDVPPLTTLSYQPRGSTALVDAVCRTIDQTGQRLAALPEWQRPSKVLLAIITDGEENSSREYTTQQLHQKITHQREKYGWTFLFLGANQDSFAVAGSYGILKTHTMNWAATAVGTAASYAGLSSNLRSFKLDGNKTAAPFFQEPAPSGGQTAP